MTFVDLSHSLSAETPVYPGDPPVRIDPDRTEGVRVSRLTLNTHAGTHVDAPSHVFPDGSSLDEFPVDRFAFDARLVDCRGVGARGRIELSDLPESPAAELLVLRTGWAEHWGTERYRDHPYLAPAAARWCAEQGLSVGIDAFSPDPTPPPDSGGAGDGTGRRAADEPDGVPAHEALLGAGAVIVENLTGLDAVSRTFRLLAFPLPIEAGDGSPVRAVGVPVPG